MNMQLLAQIVSPGIGPLVIGIVVIVLIVKCAKGCHRSGINFPLLLVLIFVAATYFKHHWYVPMTTSSESSQGQASAADDDSQARGEQLKIAIKDYTNSVLDKQIDKLNEIVAVHSDPQVAQVESTLCATTADADNEARNAAADLLLPHVKAAMEPRIAGSAMLRSFVNDDWIKNEIKSSVSRGAGITNRHVDRIDRPYGTLWKETLSVDTSAGAIQNNFVNPYQQLAEAQASGRRNEWVSLAGLVGVIILLYSFLNSATKGYFVWRLRAVATLAAIATVLVVFALA